MAVLKRKTSSGWTTVASEFPVDIPIQIMKILNHASDQIRSEAVEIHNTWRTGVLYSVGDVIRYGGALYRCITAHTSQETFRPDVSPSLWTRIMYREGIRIIPKVIGATQTFAKDEYGWWGDELYVSLIDANVHTPEQYPAGWKYVDRAEDNA